MKPTIKNHSPLELLIVNPYFFRKAHFFKLFYIMAFGLPGYIVWYNIDHFTLKKTTPSFSNNIHLHPGRLTWTLKNRPAGKGDSYWKPPFLEPMLVLGRVHLHSFRILSDTGPTGPTEPDWHTIPGTCPAIDRNCVERKPRDFPRWTVTIVYCVLRDEIYPGHIPIGSIYILHLPTFGEFFADVGKYTTQLYGNYKNSGL